MKKQENNVKMKLLKARTMNISMWLIVCIGLILSISLVSAQFTLNPFADKKIVEKEIKADMSDFIKQDFNKEYGSIRLSKTLFWMESDKIAEYTLTKNTKYCNINCEAEGKVTLYSKGILFDDVKFKTLTGEDTSIQSSQYLLFQGYEDNYVDVADTYKEVCKTIPGNEKNGTKESKKCHNVVDKTKKVNQPKEIWNVYNGEELKAGDYRWKIKGTKLAQQDVDFVPIRYDKEFSEWATWTSSFNDGLVSYYNFENDAAANITDSLGINNLTAFGTTNHEAGIIGNGLTCAETNYAYGPITGFPSGNDNRSGVMWVKTTDPDGAIFGYGATNGRQIANVNINGDYYLIADTSYVLTDWVPTSAMWIMIAYTHEKDSVNDLYHFYVNATNVGNYSKTTDTLANYASMCDMAWYLQQGYSLTGVIDEIGVWTRVLSPSEISDLWNGGAGITYTKGAAPINITVTNSHPANGTSTSSSSITFGCNITGDTNITSVVLNVTGASNFTQTISGLNNTNYNASFTNTTLITGTYNWNCLAYGGIGNSSSSIWTVTRATAAIINLTNPLNATVTNQALQNFTANISHIDDLQNTTLYIYNESGLFNKTTYTFAEGVVNYIIDIPVVLIEGVYNWFYEVFDVNNNQAISKNNTITIDLTNPALSIKYPLNTSYNLIVNALNYTIGDMNPNTCWYSTGSSDNLPDYYAIPNQVVCNNVANCANIYDNDTDTSTTLGNGFEIWANITLQGVVNKANLTFKYDSSDDGGWEQFYCLNNTDGYELIWGNNGFGYGATTLSYELPSQCVLTSNLVSIYVNYTLAGNLVYLYELGIYDFNGATNTTIPCGTNVTGLTSNQGSNTWSVYANDSAGNINSTFVTFFVDSIPPNIDVVYPEDTSYNYVVSELNYTTFDTNPSTCWYSTNLGATNTTITCGTNVTSLTSSQGTNTWIVYASDVIGNINSSTATFTVDTSAPIINITYPINTLYGQIVTALNYTLIEPNPNTCWYSTNLGATNTTITCGTNITGLTSSQGSNTWRVYANDTYGNSNSNSITFSVDSLPPAVQFVTPTDTSGVGLFRNYIVTNVTSSDYTLINNTIHIEKQGGGYVNESLRTGLMGDNIRHYNVFTNLSDGYYLFNSTSCDFLNNCNTTETRNVSIDLTGPTIVVYPPLNLTTLNGTDMTVAINISDSISPPTLCAASGVVSAFFPMTCAVTTLPLDLGGNVYGKYNLTIIAQSAGGTSTSITPMSFRTYTQRSSSATAQENSQITFYLTINATDIKTSGSNVFVRLNNTNYNGSLQTLGANFATYSVTATIPEGYGNVTGIDKAWYWDITMPEYANIKTTNQSVKIYSTKADNCAGYAYPVLNFTLYDEDSRTGIDGTIEVVVDIYKYGTTTLLTTFNNSFSYVAGSSNAVVCVSNLLYNYTLDYQTKYYSNTSLYPVEYKYAQRLDFLNNNSVQDIRLYNLLLARSTTFRFSVYGTNLAALNDAVIDIQRQYLPSNQYISVESPLTDAQGETIAHLVVGDVRYNIIISKNGVVLGTFINKLPTCVGTDCHIILNLKSSSTVASNFATYGNITAVFTLDNSSRVLTMLFTSTDGLTHDVMWEVIKADSWGNTTICTQSDITSSSMYVCNVPVSYGSELYVRVFSDGNFIGRKMFSLKDSNSSIFGGVRVLIAMLLFSTIVLLMMGNPVMLVLGGLLGIFLISALFLVDGISVLSLGSTFAYFFIAGAIIIHFLRNKT